MTYELYTGIDVPKARQAGRTSKYPLANMAVGQCFFVKPQQGDEISKTVRNVGGSVQRFRAENRDSDFKFSVRVTNHPDTNEQVVGVWRTA